MNITNEEADIPVEFSRQQELNPKLVWIHKILLIPYVIFWLGMAIGPVASGMDRSLRPVIFWTGCCIVPMLIHFFGMKGAREGTSWGRGLSKTVGILCLPFFPVLTLLGVYILRQTGDRWMSAATKETG